MGCFLYQTFENKETGEFVRITEWDGTGNGNTLTNQERELLIKDLKQQGSEPVIELDE